jgi:hypothetical protein
MLDQQPCHPSAVAAGTFNRKAAPARHPGPGEVEQPLVAGRISGHHHLTQHATYRRHRSGRQGVAVGVDADDAVHLVGQHRHDLLPPGRQSRAGLEEHRTANL